MLCSASSEICDKLAGHGEFGQRVDAHAHILANGDAAAVDLFHLASICRVSRSGISASMPPGQTLSPTLNGLAFIQPCE